MSGHSKWHNIRLRKGAQDAKRGNLFTKLAKEIIMAAKAGGGNPDTNLRLRLAIQKARESSMPQDNIKKNIQRGTGEIEGAIFEDVTYEGYGPGGAAILVDCATDNRNRTVANIRNIFNKHGGRMGESGSVSYRFRPIGVVTIAKSAVEEDALYACAVEAGAEDVRSDDENYEVIAQPEDFGAVRDAVEAAGIPMIGADITMEPGDTVQLEGKDALQNVHANFDIAEDILEAASR
jgi:YebC/PmpR family DNA-binding regulatory protein